MLDLAIVGAGVAGTSVAFRLGRLRPEWSITLYEASARVGGRLLSLRAPGVAGVRAELGGMRFRTSQPNVSRLVEELGLPARPFRAAHEDNAYLLRGSRLYGDDFRDPARVPYRLTDRFLGTTPGELLFGALETIVPHAARMTPEEWAARKPELSFGGKPLYEWSLGDALRAVVGEDGYQLITDGFGYTSVFGNRNAADGIPWLLIEARPEAENRTLVAGMEQLPRELASRFGDNGGRISLKHRLVAIEYGGAKGGADAYRLRFVGHDDEYARRVVLALPAPALRQVGGALGGMAAALADTVSGHAAAKLCLCYETAWWRQGGRVGLRSVTDMPIQKVYYFDRAEEDTPAGATLVLSYTDGDARRIWRDLANRQTIPEDELPFDSPDRWERYKAPAQMVALAHQGMLTLHAAKDAAPPSAAAFMDWGWEPAVGAYSLWNVGVQSWTVIPKSIQPSQSRELYICGESFSESQGWIEGALETAAVVIQRLTEATSPRRTPAKAAISSG